MVTKMEVTRNFLGISVTTQADSQKPLSIEYRVRCLYCYATLTGSKFVLLYNAFYAMHAYMPYIMDVMWYIYIYVPHGHILIIC